MFQHIKKGDLKTSAKSECKIKINGRAVVDWIDLRVSLNTIGDIDAFCVTLPWEVSDKPRDELLFSGSTASSVLVDGAADVAIYVKHNGDYKPIIEGRMDYATWNLDSFYGEVVTITGRSYASAPFDYRETAKYQNLTATDIHAQISEFHGLTPVAPKKTTKFVGGYDGINTYFITQEISHWDYILQLAQNEDFITYVKGKEWYFGPMENFYEKEPVVFSWGTNILDLTMERAPNAARNLGSVGK